MLQHYQQQSSHQVIEVMTSLLGHELVNVYCVVLNKLACALDIHTWHWLAMYTAHTRDKCTCSQELTLSTCRYPTLGQVGVKRDVCRPRWWGLLGLDCGGLQSLTLLLSPILGPSVLKPYLVQAGSTKTNQVTIGSLLLSK